MKGGGTSDGDIVDKNKKKGNKYTKKGETPGPSEVQIEILTVFGRVGEMDTGTVEGFMI